MNELTVIKRNVHGQETWRYQARLLQKTENHVLLEAYFNREDMDLHGMLLGKGDRFIETYYTDRFYNIFEIHAREDNHLRGWYCNVGCPAEISDDTISYIDLALDLLVFPDGRQIVLDEDEFANLDISPELRAQASHALAELQASFQKPQEGA